MLSGQRGQAIGVQTDVAQNSYRCHCMQIDVPVALVLMLGRLLGPVASIMSAPPCASALACCQHQVLEFNGYSLQPGSQNRSKPHMSIQAAESKVAADLSVMLQVHGMHNGQRFIAASGSEAFLQKEHARSESILGRRAGLT